MTRIIQFVLLLLMGAFVQAQVNPCYRTNPGIPYSTLPGDTTVIYPNGTRIDLQPLRILTSVTAET